jgi:hypothetical protein
MKYKVQIYLDDGRVYSYYVTGHDKVREHMHAIITYGYRHNDGKTFEYYPVHRIVKVKCDKKIPTKYKDQVSGT